MQVGQHAQRVAAHEDNRRSGYSWAAFLFLMRSHGNLRLVATRGLEAASLRNVAAEVGVYLSTLFG